MDGWMDVYMYMYVSMWVFMEGLNVTLTTHTSNVLIPIHIHVGKFYGII